MLNKNIAAAGKGLEEEDNLDDLEDMLSPGLGMQGKAGQKKVSLAPRANLDDLDDLDDMLDGLGGGNKINNNQISKRVVP